GWKNRIIVRSFWKAEKEYLAWRERATPMNNQVGCLADIFDAHRATGRSRANFSFRPSRVAAEPCLSGRQVMQGGSQKERLKGESNEHSNKYRNIRRRLLRQTVVHSVHGPFTEPRP
ncbi:MAG: hypothetical protein M0Z50_00170, partial [Planctomycetia bacterium]|nr:hypothetical protein [Planctomycetia bacterium]